MSDPKQPPSDPPDILSEDLSQMSDDALLRVFEESRIIIKEGGEVVIENLTASLLEVAYELDPDNEGIHCRLQTIQGQEDDTE